MSKLTRSPSFGVIVSKRRNFRSIISNQQVEAIGADPILAGSKESQRRIVNALFLTRKKTSELYKVLKEAS